MRLFTNSTIPLRIFAFLFMIIAMWATGVEAQDAPRRRALWEARKSERKAAITLHRPAKPNGAAIVICPGGGYGGLVSGAEGHGIAKWLGEHGITGIVLEYELPAGRSQVPLEDAQRAIRMARSNAKDWNIAVDRIGIMGFSAGGHLASTAGTHFDRGDKDAKNSIDRMSCRPDFIALVYPVITMGDLTHKGSRRNLLGNSPTDKAIRIFSNEQQVNKDTPPAYLAHAKDDRAVTSENSALFHAALKRHGVESEYLELPTGGHGLNGYKGPMWDAWQTGFIKWLAKQEFISAR